MKSLLVIFIALVMLLVACQAEPAQVAEEPNDADIVQEPPTPYMEPPMWPPLSDAAQRIVDSGYFSGEHPSPWGPRFSAYTNAELGLIYRIYEDDMQANPELMIYAPSGLSGPNLLMALPAHFFHEQLHMYIIDGSGEEWLQEQADYALENIIQLLLGDIEPIEAFFMRHYGDDYEENLAYRIARRDAHAQWRRENEGDTYEKLFEPITLEEVENVAFWPVEYEAAGKVFTGLQINYFLPADGGYRGITYLFTQLSNDVAVVISIYSPDFAGSVARRNIDRFEAIP